MANNHITTRGLRVVPLRVHPGYGITCGTDGYMAVQLEALSGGAQPLTGKVHSTFQQAVGDVKRAKNPQYGNPWIEVHVQGEMAHTGDGYTARAARETVLREFEGGPEPMDCRCGGTLWYRATVGAMKCPSCLALATCNGDYID